MELQFPFSIMTFLGFLFLFLSQLVKIMKTSKIRDSDRNLPPGPWKLPVIGNMLSMVSSELPHQVLRNLARKYGPLMHLQLGEISAVVVSSPQIAKEIFNHDLSFASRPEILVSKIVLYNNTDIAFAPYGAYWRQMRKICTLELLSSKKVQSFCSIREEEARYLVTGIMASSGSPINLSEKIFATTHTVTSRAAFGKRYKDQEAFLQSFQELSEAAGGFDVADLFPSYTSLHVLTGMRHKLDKLHRKIDNILDEVINKHKENHTIKKGENGDMGEEDLLDVLLRIKDNGDLDFPITLDNIKAVILDVFAAGTETTASTVEWAMSEMVKNPRVLAKAQAEVRQVLKGKRDILETDFVGMDYLKLVIKETLRLHPPVPLILPRECRERCEINGYVIPVKTKVIINAWALARDPEYWKDADNFLPERFENSPLDYTGSSFEYIPFGSGRRICPGRTFGLASVELLLAHLLYHFEWKLPGVMKPGDLDMTATTGSGARRKNSIYLIASPHSTNEIF